MSSSVYNLEGAMARLDGKPIGACPYPYMLEPAKRWKKGWNLMDDVAGDEEAEDQLLDKMRGKPRPKRRNLIR